MAKLPWFEMAVSLLLGVMIGAGLVNHTSPASCANTGGSGQWLELARPASVRGRSLPDDAESTAGLGREPTTSNALAAKRETFCLAQAVQAPKWGTPKDQTRSKNELELAMKNVFDWNVGQMIAAGGDAVFQHSHDYLGENSVVVEIGGNKGIFAQKLLERYNLAELHVVEPVTPMVKNLKRIFIAKPAVQIHQFALAREAGMMRMAYRSDNDAAAKFLGPDQQLDKGWQAATVEEVPVKTFVMAWSAMKLKIVDLININIEGIEFDLVQALLDSGVQTKIRNIQIQWHVHAGIEVADKPAKRCSMHRTLSKTHYLVYNFDWVWEQWTLK